MLSSQVGDKITLDDTRKTDRGPVVRVKAVFQLNGGDSNRIVGSYGLSVKTLKNRKHGDEFEIYLADFSDCKREGKHKGWMEFVDPADRKRWEEWKAKAQKAKA
jgi:hypothetical protein